MLEALQLQAETTIGEIRRLSRGLHPQVLTTLGFGPALEALGAEFEDAYDISVHIHLKGENGPLPGPVEIGLYRIMQEALTNVARHAGAEGVGIVVDRRVDEVLAIIDDDGRGFDVDVNSDGSGLMGIQERAAMLGGTLDIESIIEQGTTLYVRIPLQETRP